MTAAPTPPNLRIDEYEWAGGREAMLRFGPDHGPVVVTALPLFEEANRTRAFAGGILRELAARGLGGVLPDLPGQGESLATLESFSLLDLQKGYEGVVDRCAREGRRAYGVGIRSGALMDGCGLLHGRWYLAPQAGPDLLRELRRIKQATTERPLGDLWYFDPSLSEDAPDPSVELAGNVVSTALLTDLTVKQPWATTDGGPVRIVRLASDPAAADRHVAGAPLWRRSEPTTDAELASVLAADIAAWVRRCEG